MPRLLSLALVPILALAACRVLRPEPRPLPGLAIGADGRIVSSRQVAFKRRCEAAVAAGLAEDLPGWRYGVAIAEDPYPTEDGVGGYWRGLTATVTVTPAGGAGTPKVNVIAALARTRLKTWLRGDGTPVVSVVVAGAAEGASP